ncbi:MAG: PaaI family thioesterase [Planctomycetaceae bacterium]|nr:PaaI family thioesterase [Planctomycetaceae bacterium]
MELTLEQVRERFKTDRFAVGVMGIEIVEARVGYAKVKLDVSEKHFNTVNIVQGGVIFTLADFAFAVASNTGADAATVGIECNMSFIKPTTSGTLFAEAVLIGKSKSLCSYNVSVTNEKGELAAQFYGRGFLRQNR